MSTKDHQEGRVTMPQQTRIHRTLLEMQITTVPVAKWRRRTWDTFIGLLFDPVPASTGSAQHQKVARVKRTLDPRVDSLDSGCKITQQSMQGASGLYATAAVPRRGVQQARSRHASTLDHQIARGDTIGERGIPFT
jgi:hypothetical protein